MLKEMLGNSYLFVGNAPFIEELYETWLEKPRQKNGGQIYFMVHENKSVPFICFI